MSNSKPTAVFSGASVQVVEASAGSGKTFALAKRYVQILLDPQFAHEPVALRSILAITFSNKAAYEMKSRIIEFLKKIALGILPLREEAEVLRPLGLTMAQAKPAAVRIMDALIHNYNFFQVQTIDSFINAMLSGCSFKIGLSAGFKIKRDFMEYLQSSLDRMIELAAEDPKIYAALSRFLHQYLFLENKSGWFPKKDMLGLLKALYSESNAYGRDFEVTVFPGDDLVVRKKKIMAAMRELRGLLPAGTHARFITNFDEFLSQYQDGFDFDAVSRFFARETVPVNKGREVSPQLARQWQGLRAQLRQLSEAEAYTLFNPYVEIFERINIDFHRRASREDVLFLPELNRRAQQLFDDGMVTVEELYYRLATRFRHYLLDEFQDTSRLQWQNLALMIEEALSAGGTFFYVGDKKQAIYGFRGGEVRLFDEVAASFRRFHVNRESLSVNYRSHEAVVKFNNHVFSPQNLERFILELNDNAKDDDVALSPEDVHEVRNIFAASRQDVPDGKAGGYVNVEYVDSPGKLERYEEIRVRLLELIAQLKTRFRYQDIAILTRSNTEVESVTGWLMAAGVFAESERTLNIKKNTLVREVMALLRFLDSPVDDLSFATVLGGQMFGRAAGLADGEIHRFLFSLRGRREQEKDFFVYKAFRQAYPRVWSDLFEGFFKNVGLFPLYELCSSIMRRFQAFENFPDDHGFLMRFLELIREKEEDHTDLGSFLEKFEDLEGDELFVNVVNGDAIRVLTVHKSKGLQYPVVIIPFLGIKVHGSSGGDLGQQSFVLDKSAEHLKLLRIKSRYLHFSDKLADIQRREKVRSLIAELSNIYVALTRAEKEMYLFVPDKIGNSHNVARRLIPSDYLRSGAPAVYSATSGEKVSGRVGLPVAGEHDWIEFLRDEFTDAERVFDRGQALRGEALHAVLAQVGNLAHAGPVRILSEDEIEGVLAAAAEQVQQGFSARVDLSECRRVLAGVLRAGALESIFYVPDGEVFVEREIVDESGRTRRVDRLIVKKDEIWVVDFKTSREGHERHVAQARDYMGLIARIAAPRRVRGFLIYLNDASLEEVGGDSDAR